MNMKKTLSNTVICGLLWINMLLAPAHAENQSAENDKDIGLRLSYLKCLDDSGGNTSKLLICNSTEMKYQDLRLNEAYKTLIQQLVAKEASLQRAEERKWITYRDVYCAADLNSGTASDVDSIGCKVEQTAKRANLLETRLHK
jgi:uncharacterized protein YecT (DUF1311 family)